MTQHPNTEIMQAIAAGRLPTADVLTRAGEPAWSLPTLLKHLGIDQREFLGLLQTRTEFRHHK
jgi:hypothetical protein